MTKKSTFKNKKLTKALVWVMLFALLLTGQTIQSFATNYATDEPTRLTTIENEDLPSGSTCTNLSGMAYSDSYHRLYTAKVYDKDGESDGYFYYYPSVNDMDTYKMFLIKFVGHANGMTVDNSYVYITAASETSDSLSPHKKTKNHIIRISRSYIHNLTDGSTINLGSTNSNYKVFEPKYWSGNTLTKYTKKIGNITKYNSDGTFIVNLPWGDLHDGFAFTTAQIETVNGQEQFIINRTDNDIFVVHNNMATDKVTNPDIEYSPDCGLFIPRWYGYTWEDEDGNIQYDPDHYNPCKSVILWANIINGSYTLETIGSRQGIRVYTPDKINVNVSGYMDGNTPKYSFFELEAVAIYHYTKNNTEKADLIFSANVQGNNQKDGIFRLKRTDGGNFKIL